MFLKICFNAIWMSGQFEGHFGHLNLSAGYLVLRALSSGSSGTISTSQTISPLLIPPGQGEDTLVT